MIPLRLLSTFRAKVLPAASRCFLLGLGFLLAALAGASAHPHVFVEARSKLVFDDAGQAIALQHVFRFDDAFSAFAIQGFDKDGDGKLNQDERAAARKAARERNGDKK